MEAILEDCCRASGGTDDNLLQACKKEEILESPVVTWNEFTGTCYETGVKVIKYFLKDADTKTEEPVFPQTSELTSIE